MIRILCIASLLILPAVGNPASSPAAARIVKGSDHFEFTYQVTIPKVGKSGRLWLPIASSDRNQQVKLEGITTDKAHQELRDPDFNNRILTMELTPEDAGKTVELRYTVTRKENTGQPTATTEDPATFLKPDALVPLSPRLASIAHKQTEGADTDADKAAALYRHTLERMAYDKSGTGWGRGDAEHACDSRAGNCTDFHAYFIALARSIGIPARFSIGFTIPADTDAGGIGGYHCWAEYLADGRWHPVDISEADKHPDLSEYYASNHPANRFQMTVGRDLKPDPLPQSGPINFLVYPLVESDGQVVDCEREFHFKRLPSPAE